MRDMRVHRDRKEGRVHRDKREGRVLRDRSGGKYIRDRREGRYRWSESWARIFLFFRRRKSRKIHLAVELM